MVTRRRIAELLDDSGVLESVLRARRAGANRWLTVLTYHRVCDGADEQLFDRDVIDATPAELERQLALVRRYFTVIGTKELRAFLYGAKLPPNPAIITFDDGYRECRERVLPILLRQGIPAVFFVATSFISERRVFWWDRIAYILNSTARAQFELAYPEPMLLDHRGAARLVQRELLAIVKNRRALDLERFLGALADAAGVEWNDRIERGLADELVMTWDQVRELRAAGMEIQSHTRTHRVLESIPRPELASELAGARRDLEEQLGESSYAISYPVGRPIAGNAAIRAAVRSSGYEVGFSNTGATSSVGRAFDCLDIRRISMERGLPDSYFRALIALPGFGSRAAKHAGS